MTPSERLWVEMDAEDRLDEIRWRRTATPEQIKRADELTAYWYEQKDEAERFSAQIEALMVQRFGGS